MPTYPTPHPIDLAVDVQVGALEVVASDREDTVVTVTPTNPDKEADRRGAEETASSSTATGSRSSRPSRASASSGRASRSTYGSRSRRGRG